MYNRHGTLYHYTNVRNVRSIFESNELWFTSIRKFNDANEYLGSLDLLCTEFRFDEADRKRFITLFESEMSRYYVLCFSETPDNKYLLENYGNVSLEIDQQALLSLVRNATRNTCVTGYLNYRRCEYDLEAQKEMIKNALTQWSKVGKTSVPVEAFSVLAVTFKDVIYSDERETRLSLILTRTWPTEFFGECRCQNISRYKLYLHGGIGKFVKSIQIRGRIEPDDKVKLEKLVGDFNIEDRLFLYD